MPQYSLPDYTPPVGPGVGNSYRINPSTASGIIGTVYQDEYVTIVCTQYGDAVAGPWGTTTLWDHINYPYGGYDSDMWVNTATGRPGVGSLRAIERES